MQVIIEGLGPRLSADNEDIAMKRVSRAAEEVVERAAEMGIDPKDLPGFETARRWQSSAAKGTKRY